MGGWDYNKWDGGTDITGLGSNGGGSAPESSGNWNDNYKNIRQYNILLKRQMNTPATRKPSMPR